VAAVLLCTRAFEPVAAREAKSAGLAELARLPVPNELPALSTDDRRNLAARLLAEALGALTGGRS
jgi:hypothetical protein